MWVVRMTRLADDWPSCTYCTKGAVYGSSGPRTKLCGFCRGTTHDPRMLSLVADTIKDLPGATHWSEVTVRSIAAVILNQLGSFEPTCINCEDAGCSRCGMGRHDSV